ncbi:MAG TPA: protein translocase subunit SecD [Candidatus Acidoferrum sp.]|nr:protein translocase subunit SecD [Candidatus Acidoferrum sp.]
MNPNLKWKVLFITAVIVFCIYLLFGYPTFPTSLAQVKDNFKSQIQLGLDLQGGTHLTLQVQVQEAIGQETDTTVDRITTALRSKNVRYDEVRRVDDTHLLIQNIDPSQSSVLSDLQSAQYNNVYDMSPAPGQPNSYVWTLRANARAAIEESTMTQTIETIQRRVNLLGLTEPTVQPRGGANANEIIIELPGEGDPTRVKKVISEGGQLELRAVLDPQTYPSVSAYMAQHTLLPPNAELLPGRSESQTPSGGPDTGETYYVLGRAPIITGRDLRTAVERRRIEQGDWAVDFSLSPEGAGRFAPFTEQNVGNRMAILLDHKVYMAPVIKEPLKDSALIEGSFSQQSAHDLALVLRAGALPASIKYLEESSVGPSLGADSIRHGVQASVLSLLVVMVFMLIYYKLSGGNAVLALILNLVILLAVMALFSATLTLPGIAGVILTIGMGVDSNVLVFERIREEVRNGKSSPAAVEAGFDNAFRTIIDTHVTTVVSAAFLGFFGTGPIRGFAITLVVGLVANIFTAVYVSKTIFQYHLTKMDRQAELSI